MNTAIKLENPTIPDIIQSVKTGSSQELETLLNEYPDHINSQDDMGLTALHWAAHLRNYRAVLILLQTGKADAFIRDYSSKSVIDHALAGGNDDVIELILSYVDPIQFDTPE